LQGNRDKIYRYVEQAREADQQKRLDEFGVPTALERRVEFERGGRKRMLTVLQYLDKNGPANSYTEI
jgi:hypothetical protein